MPYLPTSFPRPGPLCTIYVLPCIRPFHLISRSFHRHLGHSPQLTLSTAWPFHLISGHSIGILAIPPLLMHGIDSLAIPSHLGSFLGILAILPLLMHGTDSLAIPSHSNLTVIPSASWPFRHSCAIDSLAIPSSLRSFLGILEIP